MKQQERRLLEAHACADSHSADELDDRPFPFGEHVPAAGRIFESGGIRLNRQSEERADGLRLGEAVLPAAGRRRPAELRDCMHASELLHVGLADVDGVQACVFRPEPAPVDANAEGPPNRLESLCATPDNLLTQARADHRETPVRGVFRQRPKVRVEDLDLQEAVLGKAVGVDVNGGSRSARAQRG